MSTYETSIPGAPGYAQAADLAKRAYGNAMARYAQQRSSTLLKYGYTRGADGTLSVDPNNEYGSYQQMLRGEAGQNEQLQRRQAASGWDTSSGYLGAQQDELQHAQGGEQAQLGQSLTNELAGIDQGEQQAKLDEDTADYQAQLDAARNAINTNDFNPADYSNLDVGGPYDTQTPSPAAKPAPKPVPKAAKVAAINKGKQNLIKKVTAKKGGRR